MKKRRTMPLVNFPFLSVPVKKGAKGIHNMVLRDLIELLYKRGYNIVWYDHLALDIPKLSQPILLKGKRYDIIIQIGDYLIFIEVKTKKMDKKLKEVIESYGSR